MFQPWRIKLREADEACRAGRLEDARDLLLQEELAEFRPAKQLMAKVAAALAKRAGKRAELGQTMAGWRDLEAAADLGAAGDEVAKLRENFVARTVKEAEDYLAAGEVRAALRRLEVLERRSAMTAEARRLKQVANRVEAARRLAREGQFARAEETLAAAIELRPELESLTQLRQELSRRQAEVRELRERLHQSLSAEQWTEAADAAEQLLELLPGDKLAAQARRRAWAAAGMTMTVGAAAGARGAIENTRLGLFSGGSVEEQDPGARFLMWIDGVGGYLVCEAAEIILGQPEESVHVGILGDVSRKHAVIRRSGEGYLIAPRKDTKVDGRPVQAVATLNDGNVIELGEGVTLRFRKPHPLSATARLEFVSRHRTQPPADAVILMAENCILGPGAHNHVVCRDWPGDVVVYRDGEDLHCRTSLPVEIDGVSHESGGPIHRNAQINAELLAIALEEIKCAIQS